MSEAIISLGSNLGDRKRNLADALQMLGARHCTVVAVSHLYETEPWGFVSNDIFLNQIAVVDTTLSPRELIDTLLNIEQQLGRSRTSTTQGYSSRPIDLDIIFFDDLISDDTHITLPHPKMHLRRFVLEPLNELRPHFIHPLFNKTVAQLLKECDDNSKVLIIN